MFSSSHPLSDTAFLVAYYRALESNRRDALFHDPFAENLAGERGKLWATILPDQKLVTAVIATRTRIVDDLLLDLITHKEITSVLNLGAGLDTRPYRLALPPELRWYDLDCAAILDYKRDHLQSVSPQCQVWFVPMNIADIAPLQGFLRTEIAPQDKTLIISEGILGYLSVNCVSQLTADFAQHPALQWWILELITPSPFLPRTPGHQLFSQLFTPGQDALQFAPLEGADFFVARGWHVERFHSLWREMIHCQRQLPGARLWQCLLPRIRPQLWRAVENSNSLLRLEKADPPVY